MNYLELCRRFYLESGESFTAPDSVEDASGYDLLVAGWINEKWLRIQNAPEGRRRWKWAWREWELTINDTKRDYDLPIVSGVQIEVIEPRSLTIEPIGNPASYQYLTPRDWPECRDDFRNPLSGRPSQFAKLENDKLRFDKMPDAGYTVRGEGWRGPVSLVNNTDEPEMPEAYHMLIVYEALLDYGRWESASEQYQAALIESKRLWDELILQQAPKVILGRRALA